MGARLCGILISYPFSNKRMAEISKGMVNIVQLSILAFLKTLQNTEQSTKA